MTRKIGSILVAVVVLAACGGSSSSTTTASGGSDTSTQSTVTTATPDTETTAPPTTQADNPIQSLREQVEGASVDLILSTGQISLNDIVAYRAFECVSDTFGATVNSVPVPSAGTTTVQAVIAGEVGLGEVSVGQIGSAVIEDADLKIFAPHDIGNDYVLVAKSDIASPSDMAGRIHGAAALTGQDPFNFNTIYEAAGVLDQVQVVLIGGSSDRVAALLADRVDATMLHPYDAQYVIQQGDYHSIALVADEVPPLVADVFFADTGWLQENRPLALAFAACVFAEADWVYSDPDRTLDYVMETVPDLDETITEGTLENLFAITFWGDQPLATEAVQATLDQDELGDVDASAIVDTQIMEEARALADLIER